MKWYEAAGIGTIMGCLHGVTLWASVQVRDTYVATYQSYGAYLQESDAVFKTVGAPKLQGLVMPPFNENVMLVPMVVPPVVTAFAFILLFSVPIWYPYAERSFNQFTDDIISGWWGERDDDEDDE